MLNVAPDALNLLGAALILGIASSFVMPMVVLGSQTI
jgi:hypothetical protein